jgi:serpin B
MWLYLLTGLLGLSLLSGCAPAAATGVDMMAGITPAPAPSDEPVPDTYTAAMGVSDGSCCDRPRRTRASAGLARFGSSCVSVTLNGSDTETREQMLALLGDSSFDTGQLNRAARIALARWNKPGEDDRLTIANSIWFNQTFEPDPAFLQVNADHYTAAARKLDFHSDEALEAINGWVKEATRGLIPTVLDRIPADAVMYLVNAIYFQADWTEPFAKTATRTRTFHAPDGDIETDFMHRSGSMQYLQKDGMTGVLLPYKGERFAFFAILPDAQTTPRDLLVNHGEVDMQAFVEALQSNPAQTEVDLALPRFEVSYQDSLVDELTAMGMVDAFDSSKADFSLLQTSRIKDLFISNVIHKTFCRVDEKGTEAAAVVSGNTGDPHRLRIPFLMAPHKRI